MHELTYVQIYHINGKGGATIHITKISRGDFEHVKVLAFKVVKFLLDNIISGNFESEDIEKMRIKSFSKTSTKYLEISSLKAEI